MLDEILIKARFIEPTLVKLGEEFQINLEINDPEISISKSKKKYLKHLHNNLFSLSGEIKKIRTSNEITQMIVDCSLPILVTLNFSGEFKKPYDYERYRKISAKWKVFYRIFRHIYYILIDIYHINRNRSYPLFILDGKVKLKFLKEGDYIESQSYLFSYLDGGWEENSVEQKIICIVSSVESADIEKTEREYFSDNIGLLKLKIKTIKDIKYVELDNFFDHLVWAVIITLSLIFGWILLIAIWIAYIILFPIIFLRRLWIRIRKNSKKVK